MKKKIVIVGLVVWALGFQMKSQNTPAVTKHVTIGKKKTQAEENLNKVTKAVSIYRVSDKIKFEFISPEISPIKTETGELELICKIHGLEGLSTDSIQLLVDNLPVESKGDVVSLFNADAILHFEKKLILKPGEHMLQLRCNMEDGPTYSKKIKVISGSIVVGSAVNEDQISWITPDPFLIQNEVLELNQLVLPIEFQLVSQFNLSLADFQIIIDGQRHILSPHAELQKYGERTRVKDQITLVNLGQGEHEIFIQAVGKEKPIKSKELRLNFSPQKPDLHIISIGTKTNLKYTVKDAIDFAAIFDEQGMSQSLFNEVHIMKRVGEKAASNEIKGIIEELNYKMQYGHIDEQDVIVLFISSHGFILNEDLRIQGDDYDPLRKNSTSVSYKKEILEPMMALNCKKLIFIDACHSGGAKGLSPDIGKALLDLEKKAEGLAVITSSQAEEVSYEDQTWRNGAFTEAIVRALSQGAADADNNKIVTILELFSYLEKEVPAMVLEVKNEMQHPKLVRNELGDLPLFLIQN